jgi:hypothetical protein
MDQVAQEKALLLELLRAKGYRDPLVLGPFGGVSNAREYTVPLYDATGRAYRETLRGTYADLREEILTLPGRGAQ